MNLLVQLLCFSISITAISDDKPEILSDQDLKDKFLTVVRDNEVEKRLEQSTEFNECIKGNKFDSDEAVRKANAQKAEQCFQKKLSGKSPEELQKLSQQFQLENFGLVNSSNTKDITEYFGDKLYKAMTGIDRRDQKQKDTFKNRKMVKQKDFIELYHHHISKSVMYEISRFCFENLRSKTSSAGSSSFAEHWSNHLTGSGPLGIPLDQIDDSGSGGFGIDSASSKETKTSYDAIFKGISGQGNLPTNRLGDFYGFCIQAIPKLCEQFRGDSSKPGAKACLVQDKLKKIRTAISNTGKIKEYFDTSYVGGSIIKLKDQQIESFVPEGDNSYSNLTDITSFDILEGGKNSDDHRSKLAEECLKTPEKSECEKFITTDDSRSKVEFNTDLTERLQKQTEIARILELKKGDQKKLQDYLTEKGYLELASKIEKNPNTDIEKEIAEIFDAKREATLKSISEKIGKRQLSKEDAKDKSIVEESIKSAAEDTVTERARISQVVLFNNIILGFVDAQNKQTKETKRYVNAWRREEQSLESDAKGKIDENLFAGFKQTISSDKNSTSGSEIVQVDGLLDVVLGK